MSKKSSKSQPKPLADPKLTKSKQAVDSLPKADYYDETGSDYTGYWQTRNYEQQAEMAGITKLLGRHRFSHAVDVGGGYGRLSIFLTKYAKQVTLAEPSKVQLAEAARRFGKKINIVQAQVESLPLEDESVDLVLVVRLLHHIPDPSVAFAEIYRILKPGGYFLLEFANSVNIQSRLRHGLKLQRVPKTPISVAQLRQDIPFVNHHPATIIGQLATTGFELNKKLSVSNFRSSILKKSLPQSVLVGAEKVLQQPLAVINFGPSSMYLLRK